MPALSVSLNAAEVSILETGFVFQSVAEQAIEAEAQAQAICMQTGDFKRAYEAFSAKRKPVFEGN